MKNYDSKLKAFKFLTGVFTFSFLIFNSQLVFAQILPPLAPQCNPTLPPSFKGTAPYPAPNGPSLPPCNITAFVAWIRQIIQFLTAIAIPIGVLFIAYGAFVIMTAGGSEERVRQGRGIITAAAIGVAITFGAWLIVTTVNKILTGGF